MEKFNYQENWEKANRYFLDDHYNQSVLESAIIFEQAHKELLTEQALYYTRCKDNKRKEIVDFNNYIKSNHSRSNLHKLTFGVLQKFYSKLNLFDSIEKRLNHQLTVTKTIPWEKIRGLRNDLLHNGTKATRDQALEVLQYLKYFLLETLLSPTINVTVNDKCERCDSSISKDWNYCPNCSLKQKILCKNKECKYPLKYFWVSCPKCTEPIPTRNLPEAEDIYSYYCKAVWSDGHLNSLERIFLLNKRRELALAKSSALSIEEKFAPEDAVRFKVLVEAVLIDKKITKEDREFLINKATELKLSISLANSIYRAIAEKFDFKPLLSAAKIKTL